MRRTKTIIIGAGQAGLPLSRSLRPARHHHVVLELGRIGASWLERWDSLALLTPNWLNQLAGGEAHADAGGYLGAREFAVYLRRYGSSFRAPVHEHAAVTSVEPKGDAFDVRTEAGRWLAKSVVITTGWAAEERFPEVSRSARTSCSTFTRAGIGLRRRFLPAASSWSAPVRAGSRSRRSCDGRADASCSRSVRTTAACAATAAATSGTGCVRSATSIARSTRSARGSNGPQPRSQRRQRR
jgi:Pyridine nucleotide-disulphide oxidoreductase